MDGRLDNIASMPAFRIFSALGALAILIFCAASALPAEKPDFRPRVFLIGIDGLDPNVLKELIDKGKLPNFQRLLKKSAHGLIREDELPSISPVVWTSIATGVGMEKHGIKTFMKGFDESGEQAPYSRLDIRVPALWDILPAYRKKAAFIGWHTSWPVKPTGGVMISDRLHLDCGPGLENVSPPRILSREAIEPCNEKLSLEKLKRFMNIDPARYESYSDKEKEAIGNYWDLFKRNAVYFRAIKEVLANADNFDLIAMYLRAPDSAGHIVWKYRDAESFSPDQGLIDKFGKTFDRTIQLIDEELGDILPATRPNDWIFLLSDHGFGTQKKPEFESSREAIDQNRLIEAMGFLHFADADKKTIDWRRTKIFPANPSAAGDMIVKVNLRTESNVGIVEPRDLDATMAAFLNVAKSAKTSDGKPLFLNAADLIENKSGRSDGVAALRLKEKIPFDYVSLVGGSVARLNLVKWDWPIAGHSPDGVLIASGPGIHAGPIDKLSGHYDIAPTILHLLGLPIPENMDGEMMTWLFEPGFLRILDETQSPVEQKDIAVDKSPAGRPSGDADSSRLLEELRSLGYIQ